MPARGADDLARDLAARLELDLELLLGEGALADQVEVRCGFGTDVVRMLSAMCRSEPCGFRLEALGIVTLAVDPLKW